jgi:hypothetical protein
MNDHRPTLYLNYTPSSASTPALANLNPDRNSNPFYAVILHHFGKRLEYVDDFAERLEQFRAITADMEGKMYYHVNADLEGQQFCVYDKEKHILEARDFSYRLMMPESAWHVTESRIIRSVLENNVERKKVWERYQRQDGQKVWDCTYTEHARDPLYLRQGNIPVDARQFLREVYKQLNSNTRLTNQERNILMWSLQSWDLFGSNLNRQFTDAELTVLSAQARRLQHLHNEPDFRTALWVLLQLDVLTPPEAAYTLEYWADAYSKTPNPSEWPTVLRNAYTRNQLIVGRYVA